LLFSFYTYNTHQRPNFCCCSCRSNALPSTFRLSLLNLPFIRLL
jgi:hypothetical protein